MAVITISKEFGTDSEAVASALAKKLGYESIGRRLLAQIARELHLSESEVNTFRQASKTSILRYLDKYTCAIVQKVVDKEQGCLDDKAYYEKTKELVEKLYRNDNVVILGWGAQCILKGRPNALHVRLRKDHEKKVDMLMEKPGMDRKGAERKIKDTEEDSRVYIKHYFEADWNDVSLYDLVIDMGDKSVEEAVDLICDNLKYKLKSAL